MKVRIVMVFISIFVICVSGQNQRKCKTHHFRRLSFTSGVTGIKRSCMYAKQRRTPRAFAFKFTHKQMPKFYLPKKPRDYESGRQSECILSDNSGAVASLSLSLHVNETQITEN